MDALLLGMIGWHGRRLSFARISRGRIIRQFVLGTLIIRSRCSWLSVFGNSAGNPPRRGVCRGDGPSGAASLLARYRVYAGAPRHHYWPAILCDDLGGLSARAEISPRKDISGPGWPRVFWSVAIGY